MANSVRISASLDDNVSGPLDKIRGSFDEVRKQGAAPLLTGAAIAGTTMAIGAITSAIGGIQEAFVGAIQGAIEEEASLKRLSTAISENDKSWDGNIDAINEVIDARGALGFADDEQRDSLSKLVAITGDSSKALDLQRQAMDFARLRGIDLASAGDILGKVFTGNTGILSRYGIEVRKGASAQEALAAIQRKASGQAEAFGETTAGSMKAAEIAVGNLSEEFGAVFLPVVKEGAQFLTTELIPAIKSLASILGDAATAAGDAAADIDEFFKPVSDVLNGIVASGKDVRQALFGIETSISDVADAFNDAYPSIGILWEKLKEGVATVGPAVEDAGRVFGSSWGKLADEVRQKARDLPLEIAAGIIEKRDAPVEAFDQLLEMLKEPMSRTAEVARDLGILASKKLAEGLGSNDPAIRQQARGVVEIAIQELEDLKVRPGLISEAGMKSLVKAMKSEVPAVRNAAIDVYETVRDGLPQSGEMGRWGDRASAAWSASFVSNLRAAQSPIDQELYNIRQSFEAHSPPKSGPLKDIDKWAKNTGLAWVNAFVDTIGDAEHLTKIKLGGVQKAFREFLKGYGGVSGGMPSAGPEMSRERLTEYIANLTKTLETTTDEGERLAILSQIADYQQRLDTLMGKQSTESEKDVAKLMGYLDSIDKALLVEKDPSKRAKLIAQWVVYYNRIQRLTAPEPEAEEPAAWTDPAEQARHAREIEIDLQRLTLERERATLNAEADKARIEVIDAELASLSAEDRRLSQEREITRLLHEQAELRREMGIPAGEPVAILPSVPGMGSAALTPGAGAGAAMLPPEPPEITVTMTVEGGLLMPNSPAAEELANAIGPALVRWLRVQQIITGLAGYPAHAHQTIAPAL